MTRGANIDRMESIIGLRFEVVLKQLNCVPCVFTARRGNTIFSKKKLKGKKTDGMNSTFY